MGRKKTVMKMPKQMTLMCPHCKEKNKANVSIDICPQSFTCPKCNAEVKTPLTQCCVLCAYSNKPCPRTLYMNAKAKGLEIK